MRRAFTRKEVVQVVIVVTILAAILIPFLARERPTRLQSSCQSNLKQISLGIAEYIQNNDNKFPLVKSGQDGWMDIIQPYIKARTLFQCPMDESRSISSSSDYFYNARLAGQKMATLNFTPNTIMLGDGVTDLPSNANLSELPSEWVNDSNSPAYRHLNAANYVFADRHIEWLKPTLITNDKASSTVYTFALR